MKLHVPHMRWLIITGLVVVLDAWTKSEITRHLALYQSYNLLPGLLDFTLLHNTGAAFSFLYGAGGWQRWLFAGIAVVVSGALLVWLLSLAETMIFLPLAISLIMGGALGNLLDRLSLGYVVDFIHVHYHGWHFPAFNVADSAITLGTVMLLIDMAWFEERRRG